MKRLSMLILLLSLSSIFAESINEEKGKELELKLELKQKYQPLQMANTECDIPGYLRTKNCEAKNVLFSWRIALPSAVAITGNIRDIEKSISTDIVEKSILESTGIGLSANIGINVQFGAYYRIWDNLLIGANAGIGFGAKAGGFAAGITNIKSNSDSEPLSDLNFGSNVYIPIEGILKYYFNLKSFSVGLGVGGDVSFKDWHTFRTFTEFGWPGFSLRLGYQYNASFAKSQVRRGIASPLAVHGFYSAIVFGY